jgi:pseudaminic acid cytidylyltransferase
MRLAVIPARGGSKRIPRKNVRVFGGKPMIVWSIEAAIQSGCFDRVLVSTDDFEIAQVAKDHGADVPFQRPAELSDDHTGTGAVIAHATKWNNDNGISATQVCCIYATAPFVLAQDLQRGLALLNSSDADFVFTVTSYAYPIQRALRITQEERIEMFHPSHISSRSQDLEEAWHDAGLFYWGGATAWLNQKNAFLGNSLPLVLPRHRVQDIDTEEDWVRAELMFNTMLKNRDFYYTFDA